MKYHTTRKFMHVDMFDCNKLASLLSMVKTRVRSVSLGAGLNVYQICLLHFSFYLSNKLYILLVNT